MHKQQPNLQMQASSINLCFAFDIASELQQEYTFSLKNNQKFKQSLQKSLIC